MSRKKSGRTLPRTVALLRDKERMNAARHMQERAADAERAAFRRMSDQIDASLRASHATRRDGEPNA